MSNSDEQQQPVEIAYGSKAISAVVGEPNLRVLQYRLASGYIPGAWKAGKTWALTVPVFRRAVGLDDARSRTPAVIRIGS